VNCGEGEGAHQLPEVPYSVVRCNLCCVLHMITGSDWHHGGGTTHSRSLQQQQQQLVVRVLTGGGGVAWCVLCSVCLL
jgi:hypothetical protein